MILALRTDIATAHVSLVDADGTELVAKSWEAGRTLSDTLLVEIEQLLATQNAKLADLSGIVVFEGPGSFTGLRIGVTIANTLAFSLNIPISGASGEAWIEDGISQLDTQEQDTQKFDRYVTPEYGGEANITKPRK